MFRPSPGDLIAVHRGLVTATRKVAVVGHETRPGWYRVQFWHHKARRFGVLSSVEQTEIVGPAPDDWIQTKHAKKALELLK